MKRKKRIIKSGRKRSIRRSLEAIACVGSAMQQMLKKQESEDSETIDAVDGYIQHLNVKLFLHRTDFVADICQGYADLLNASLHDGLDTKK